MINLMEEREKIYSMEGFGADTFICDKYDQIIDFESTEGDKKIGKCSVVNK
jgi:hypothetical protein